MANDAAVYLHKVSAVLSGKAGGMIRIMGQDVLEEFFFGGECHCYIPQMPGIQCRFHFDTRH